MNSLSTGLTTEIRRQLQPALPGMFFAALTLLFGFGMGIIFGLNEEMIKARLKASAAEVRESVYKGDEAAITRVLDKSWVYMQRAHLHAGGLAATALGLSILVSLLGTRPGVTRAISLGLGVGALGYSLYWVWAGFRAPGLGGTGAAKESLKWLAMPSSGAIVLATAAATVVLLTFVLRRQAGAPAPSATHA